MYYYWYGLFFIFEKKTMQEISFESNFTPRDLQAAYMAHVKIMSYKRIVFMISVGILLMLCGATLLLLHRNGNNNNFLAWFFLFYGIFIPLFYFWRLNRMGKTAFKKLVDLHYVFHTSIDENGISTKSKSINSESKWEHFSQALITNNVILLYPNKLKFVIICRRFLSDDDFTVIAGLVLLKVQKTRDKRK